MTGKINENLLIQINDLDCEISYLKQADRMNILPEIEQGRLNSLIIRKAHVSKVLENQGNNKMTTLLLDKLKVLTNKSKRICDYF